MKKIILLALFTLSLVASEAKTKKQKQADALKEAMAKEQKYAQEQMFYQGAEYDLGSYEVNPNSVDDMPLMENQDDFDMDDVY
jgi:hypothetical protein